MLLEFADRQHFGGEVANEVFEALVGFAAEQNGVGKQAVTGGVAGGDSFAGGGFRAAGFLRNRGGRMSYMKLIKLLYLADREALPPTSTSP